MEIFEAIRNFKKVNWQDIPDQGLYSTQLIEFINENLIAFFPDMVSLTPSMINNYVKADIVPI